MIRKGKYFVCLRIDAVDKSVMTITAVNEAEARRIFWEKLKDLGLLKIYKVEGKQK